MSATTTATERREAVQQSLRTGEFDQSGFGSPEHGSVVELLMCEYLGLTFVDGPVSDARASDGTPIQIKACQREHSNGGGQTVPGRWDAWSETLLHLLADGGQYLLVVYDGDQDPAEVTPENLDEYVLAWRFMDADEFGAHIGPDAWHDGNRPSKGKKARVFWNRVFDGVDA
ncbi:hypothetical protein BGV91_gp42 [Haloarcula californiae icosahedral virus 1]|uniref:Uncharacterized protein n=1 Tax=Haloarcula californiae icosahedral virus 1 TaxID=1735722 RepID=A0A1C7A3T1_9VIRU|nr:hypothetical protein BGV91_gp42 [Haloarcula californiae icosahedral virus 1]ALJ99705.1 hypothetical protein SS136_042 [Haloarcula californiae icosahedral virus 1]